jgi:hypothetical protein
MPWSQMMSMNWRPPRPMEAISPAKLPAANTGERNSWRWNIGSGERSSMTQNATSSATPPNSPARTHGLVQPVLWLPYGWMP